MALCRIQTQAVVCFTEVLLRHRVIKTIESTTNNEKYKQSVLM